MPPETTIDLNPEQTADSLNNNEIIPSVADTPKFSIPGIPDEIMEKLNLSDCMLGGPIDEFIDKLDPNDPRYSLFTKLGQEMCKNKDMFTYNNLSLSGISWHALYQIEKVLNKKKEKDCDFDECNRVFDSGIGQKSDTAHCMDLTVDLVNDGGISSAESCYGSMIGSVPPENTQETNITESLQNSEMDTTQVETFVNTENATQPSSGNVAENFENEEAMDISPVDSSANPETGTQCSSCDVVENAENEEAINASQIDSSIHPETGTSCCDVIETTEKEDSMDASQIDASENPENGTQFSSCENDSAIFTSQPDIAQNLDHNITTSLVSSSLVVDESESAKPVQDVSNSVTVVGDKKIPPPDLRINMFKFPIKLFTKSTFFQLPGDLNSNKKSTGAKDKDTSTTLKRKSTELTPSEKRCKTYSLCTFENFWNSAEAQKELPEGEQIQIVEQQEVISIHETGEADMFEITIEIENAQDDDGAEIGITDIRRYSLDNPGEWNCGRPITPESGRSSFYSEFGHMDEDDDGPRRDPTLSRADSGIELSAPLTPASIHPDELASRTSENPTLKTLKALFPTTFSDPERAQVLKDLYRQPEDSEEYNEWKKFIHEKTANETEFDIHKGGSEILDSFPTRVEGETISFQSIVQDKSVGDIARLFVSALQLVRYIYLYLIPIIQCLLTLRFYRSNKIFTRSLIPLLIL